MSGKGMLLLMSLMSTQEHEQRDTGWFHGRSTTALPGTRSFCSPCPYQGDDLEGMTFPVTLGLLLLESRLHACTPAARKPKGV